MSYRHASRTILIASTLLAATVTLQGCAAIDEVLHKQRSLSFSNAEAAFAGWDLDAPWVPAEATGIRVVESTVPEAPGASVLIVSDAELDPELCEEASRQSAPSYSIDGSPDPYGADTVFACGPWSVIRSDTGWFGWTPNHPDEEEQSPATL